MPDEERGRGRKKLRLEDLRLTERLPLWNFSVLRARPFTASGSACGEVCPENSVAVLRAPTAGVPRVPRRRWRHAAAKLARQNCRKIAAKMDPSKLPQN